MNVQVLMSHLGPTRPGRFVALLGVAAGTAAFLAYMVVGVPLPGPTATYAALLDHRSHALLAALVVAVVDALFIWRITANLRAARLAVGRPSWRIPARGVAVSVGGSLLAFLTAVWVGIPLWAVAMLCLLPWTPIYFDVVWRHQRYRWYAVFASLVLLQVGHLGEHVAQNVQLLLTHDPALSRGIISTLDVEDVHFVWNVVVWLLSGALLVHFGPRNRWLAVAFATASVHTVEHMYLFWLYVTDSAFYQAGGSAGILASGGLLASPLARPYLHLAYNVAEVVPLLLAFWDQRGLGFALQQPPSSSHVSRKEPRSMPRSLPRPLFAILFVTLFSLALTPLVAGAAGSPALPTGGGYQKFLVYMSDGLLDPSDQLMLPGLAAYHRDIMRRSPEQIAAHKAQAIAFFQERYGVDFSASDTADGWMLGDFMLNPKVEYRAYSISGEVLPAGGWNVRDGGWAMLPSGSGGHLVYGTWGGQDGTSVPEGGFFAYGDYNIQPDTPGRAPILIHYQAIGPMVPAADGSFSFSCEISSPDFGAGLAQGYFEPHPLLDGRVVAHQRTVLTFPSYGAATP